jgi:excinuclease ABC subunit C
MDKAKKIHFEKILKTIPHNPGVYKFFQDDKIIYIGKAKDLKKRVTSYFRSIDKQAPKTRKMVEHATDLEYVVVDTELEALMLETNLIKEFRPKYNILMKDDKNFVYLKVTTQKDYPKFYLTRKMIKDGSTYFGPKTSAYDIKKALEMVNVLFPYKHCRINIKNLKSGQIKKETKANPHYCCLFKKMDRGHEPCIHDLPKDEYQKLINKVLDFLKGKHTELLENLQSDMLEAASNKQFEKAALLRDKLQSIQNILEKQKISSGKHEEIDVIDIIYSQKKFFAVIFQIREGKIINQENFILDGQDEDNPSLVFQDFLTQYYSEAGFIPKEILIPEPIEDKTLISDLLSDLRGSKVTISIPKIGRKNNLLNLANKNALSYAQQMKVKWLSEEQRDPLKSIENLKEILKLPKVPKRIECYDISHLSGTNTIGSMVVFQNGMPKKSDYRSFNIKQLASGEINDFDSLYEVLKRRLKYISKLPSHLKLRKKGDTYTLFDDKKKAIQIEFESLDNKTIALSKLEIEKDYLNYLSRVLKDVIHKLKAKKCLINPKNQDVKRLLLDSGFQEIDHQEYSHGYYSQKQNLDKSFGAKPDLIVIDGGKGQLSSTLKAKQELEVDIPFVSIAKKHEIIYLEDKTEIHLPDNSPERHLIQQLRDEAHRFAITKNRNKRIKKMRGK